MACAALDALGDARRAHTLFLALAVEFERCFALRCGPISPPYPGPYLGPYQPYIDRYQDLSIL